ncbi:MAG TPA: glycosyl hydrolase-related protein [Candidatus Binatia bacterium]|nr:glycosyl hydrolase-related protein [Candidatus Binatia bacterium]
MEWLLVSHFHWDREWYRPFQAFRARLVDAIDRVLDCAAADPGYRFLLDGQAIVLEDYLAVRPERRAELERGVRAGRLAVGPWYVQPDSLLPDGEAHVRNLLLGRRVAGEVGPVSEIAYVPDSFGHPAQLPQLFAGFGLRAFVYWRGNGSEIDALGRVWRWTAPDGSSIAARLLAGGYFEAACLPEDPDAAARGLARIAQAAGETGDVVVLMNGFDHMFPDRHTGAVAERLAAIAGAEVRRGVLDDLPPAPDGLPEHRGELVGARLANLLAGVWSARTPLKLANRACENELLRWAEPWCALGRALGLRDERPALAAAWKALLANQAHDSICGCSTDEVHDGMRARFSEAEGLARETGRRVLERLAGLGDGRAVPWSAEQDVVVFNPSPEPATGVVRVALDAYPPMRLPLGLPEMHPLALLGDDAPGFAVDGEPARAVSSPDPARVSFLPGMRPVDVEFVARDVPALGCRRYRLSPAAPARDAVDAERALATGDVEVDVADDGTLAVRFAGGTRYAGLFAIEDLGDRGDSYDADLLDDASRARVVDVSVERRRHPSGIAAIAVRRRIRVPAALDASRDRRSEETVDLDLALEARLAPGVPRVDVAVLLENRARDHRLRLLFPTGRATGTFRAATTFDAAERSVEPPDAAGWVHPAPRTFPCQGWVSANGLTVAAPALAEAEVRASGEIAFTLVRAVGWLARYDLRSRPIPAGPAMEVAGAQCLATIAARFALFASAGDGDARAAAAAEAGLRAAIGGPAPLLAPGRPLFELDPSPLVLAALKPAESGAGFVARVLNPTGERVTARIRLGVPFGSVSAVRLDEEPAPVDVARSGDAVSVAIGPHALCSLRFSP